ncbi:catalase [Lujinxingia vulgaris]|uniref:Catalase n=1 Tax=Lujinxingia vulgaris TaxID=2600176 RepID=A0A5C6XHR1_9DELT|nr:catalase [Lujinxingia vulgaris]TXD38395.1 catalase [Lujinxingia vulgaris]
MSDDKKRAPTSETSKREDLERHTSERGTYLTTNQGLRVDHTDDSLKAGERGPTLMEDFHFREKMTHFDHERIPERVVHARGSAAHGYFELYEDLSALTRARFLCDTSMKTPVFVRFSTVVGFRGSADTVRDVRGFATKFFTQEGNYDLVGNNMPVFFIQDAVKFPDLVHSIKPEPHNQMPQASAAHDNFWDFVGLVPESTATLMWVLSDRAIPRSYRMMEGFGVHTFRLVNEAGDASFVKFHWKPKLGTHGLVWDEAQKLAGKDPDFHRRDLWEAIEAGDFPEFELGLQVVPAEDEHRFDFDLLDPTKFIPEEEVPVRRVGRMVLNRNPDNFFAETEQVAFHPGHVVPGIDFTNDPLLQGRLFSYIDTQLIRLGGPNFSEIPINRPVAPVHNNQRDGYGRQTINRGNTNYYPNSTGGGCPMMASATQGAYVHLSERVDGHKIKNRSDSFRDHFSQATLFWNSLTDAEKDHLVSAAHFELGKVSSMEVRERMVNNFNEVDHDFACRVAAGIGVAAPKTPNAKNHGKASPAVSMEATVKDTITSRKVAVLLADGFAADQLNEMRDALKQEGARVTIVSEVRGTLSADDGSSVEVDKPFVTTASIMFDALYIPGGQEHIDTLKTRGDALHFINEAFKHYKPIAATAEGVDLLRDAAITGIDLADAQSSDHVKNQHGVISLWECSNLADFTTQWLEAIAQHRHWGRDAVGRVPA